MATVTVGQDLPRALRLDPERQRRQRDQIRTRSAGGAHGQAEVTIVLDAMDVLEYL